MASRFWVGGGSANTWAATVNTNWATTSGGANNASVPTTTDFAFFDANSGVGNSVIGASTAIQGIDCTGYTGTLTLNTSQTLTINTAATNAFKLAAGMTYVANVNSIIAFTNTSGTAQITSAGKAVGSLTVNGVGGTVQQADDLAINAFQGAILTITNGTFDCNSHALTACQIAFTGTNTRGFLLGSSVTVGGNIATGGIPWSATTTTSLTFTKNSANLTVLSPTSGIALQTLNWGSLTYNGVTINATTTGVSTSFSGSPTFATWAIGSGNTFALTNGTTTTVSGAFTWTGASTAPITFQQLTVGGVATISCPSGACSLTWGFLSNVTGSGGATFTATNTLSGGSNPGWSISPPFDAGSLTPSAIATAVWQDLLASGDFSTSSSIGAMLKAASNLQFTVAAIGRGTVTTGASTTSIPTSAFTPATSASVANQLVGRVVLFDAATTTVALRGQAATISASSASATPTMTVSTLTATPASGDLFSVV